MKKTMRPVKIMNWAACILFLASLFQPMEQHAVSGPCGWPCRYPFTYSVFDNTFIFVLAPIFILFRLLAWDGFKVISAFAVYSFIGIGEIRLFITPLLDNKLNSSFRQHFHLSLVFLAVVGILFYGLISDFRLGMDPLRIGYYDLALSFLLIFLSSSLRFIITITDSDKPSRL